MYLIVRKNPCGAMAHLSLTKDGKNCHQISTSSLFNGEIANSEFMMEEFIKDHYHDGFVIDEKETKKESYKILCFNYSRESSFDGIVEKLIESAKCNVDTLIKIKKKKDKIKSERCKKEQQISQENIKKFKNIKVFEIKFKDEYTGSIHIKEKTNKNFSKYILALLYLLSDTEHHGGVGHEMDMGNSYLETKGLNPQFEFKLAKNARPYNHTNAENIYRELCESMNIAPDEELIQLLENGEIVYANTDEEEEEARRKYKVILKKYFGENKELYKLLKMLMHE